MKKEKFDFVNIIKNSALNKGEFYVKLCFTILFATIFVISFFAFNGYQYFYSNVYASDLKGDYFQIHTIDVKQGDCFLIKLPNNQCMMIDCGKEQYSEYVNEYISQFMYAERIQQIDYLVLTHPDSDHIGGAESVLLSFKVVNLLRPPIYSCSESDFAQENGFTVDDSLIYDDVIKLAKEKRVEVTTFYQGLTLSFKGCTAEFLSPKIKTYNSSNNYSAVIMFSYQTKKFLFMGDAEQEIEQKLLAEYGSALKADVLKVGHHGSITSSSQDFLEAVNPAYAIISSGNSSQYFPNSVVIDRLNNLHVKILQTSRLGNLVVGVKNLNIIYSTAKRPPNHVALIFSVLLIFTCIVWENPFKGNKTSYLQKTQEN